MNSVVLAFEGQSPALQSIYSHLVANHTDEVTNEAGAVFGSVYLQDAQLDTMLPAALFNRYLTKLQEIGLYKSLDGKAWGAVRLN